MDSTITPRRTLNKISEQNFKQLVENQKLVEDRSPLTTRATFKLSLLEDLIEEIKSQAGYNGNDEDYHHHICVTFVRDNIDMSILGYGSCKNLDDLKSNSTEANGAKFTQLIPIITGCDAILDPKTGKCTEFSYMRIKNEIPYVRSGGETSGLIPPPPPSGDDPAS